MIGWYAYMRIQIVVIEPATVVATLITVFTDCCLQLGDAGKGGSNCITIYDRKANVNCHRVGESFQNLDLSITRSPRGLGLSGILIHFCPPLLLPVSYTSCPAPYIFICSCLVPRYASHSHTVLSFSEAPAQKSAWADIITC